MENDEIEQVNKVNQIAKDGTELRKEDFKNLVNIFKEKVLSLNMESGCSEQHGPYLVECELGDYYVKNENFNDDFYLSVNNKGLVALHNKDGLEVYHVEKDFDERLNNFVELITSLLSNIEEF